MPAVSKNRKSKHAETPYTRQKKVTRQDDGQNNDTTSKTLIENAAKGLYRLVSWVFTSGEDLSKNLGASASKAVHREQPRRSQTSQLEDGTWNENSTASESMLAPDLVPHYLGKTPLVVKVRRDVQSQSRVAAPAFRVPSFDATQFKIPTLPTPPRKETRTKETEEQNISEERSRGRSLKSLQIDASTQGRHDDEIKHWLNSQNLRLQDLVNATSISELLADVEDHQKLRTILADSGFFRRQGVLPPVLPDAAKASKQDHLILKHESKPRQRSTSRSSAMSLDKPGSERSSSILRPHKINSREWQTNTSTGILAAWRDICQQQESQAQNDSLAVEQGRRSGSRAASSASTSREPMLWHEDISFVTKKPSDMLEPVFELEAKGSDGNERYWAPIRSFPMPRGRLNSQERENDMKVMANLISNGHRPTRTHSRQSSLAKRPRSRRSQERALISSKQESRPHTPVDVSLIEAGRSRRPVNASRSASRTRQHSVDTENLVPKPEMVDSQVQTGDELMSFLADDQLRQTVSESPTISKERRKRPGCFSALDEDMEDLFGPYTDNPPKRSKVDDEDEAIARPRIPLFKEDEAVKKLRAQQRRERESMPPPTASKDAPNMSSNNSSLTQGTSMLTHANDSTIGPEPSTTASDFPPLGTTRDKFPRSTIILDTPSTLNASQTASNDESTTQSGTIETPKESKQQTFPSFDFGHTTKQVPAVDTVSAESQTPQFSFGKGNSVDARSEHVPEPVPFTFGTKAVPAKTSDTSTMSSSHVAVPNFAFPRTTMNTADKTGATSNIGSSKVLPETLASTKNVLDNQTFMSNSKYTTDSSSHAELTNSAKNAKDIPAFSGLANSQVNNREATPTTAAFSFVAAKSPPTPFGAQSAPATRGTSEAPTAAPVFSFGGPKVSSDLAKSQIVGAQSSNGEVLPKTTAPSFTFGDTQSTKAENNNSTPIETQQKPFVSGSSISQKNSDSSAPFSGGATSIGFGASTTRKSDDVTPTFVFGQPTSANVTSSTKANETPVFKFGTQAQSQISQPEGKDKTAPAFSFDAQPQSSEANETLKTNPVFGFGAQEQNTQPKESIAFGQQFPHPSVNTATPATTNTTFGSAPPTTNSTGFSFNPSGFGSAPASVQSPGTGNPFGQQNATVSGPAFGAVPATQPNNSIFGGQPATNTNTTFTFGAPNGSVPATTGNVNGNVFGSTASPAFGATPQNNTFNFGQPNAGQPSNSASSTAFQFGATTQSNAQPFVFGQAQTAPNSGFASPAIQSPSLASVTAPGSPNPFDFSGATNNATGTANTPRKVLQPRSRRPRNAR